MSILDNLSEAWGRPRGWPLTQEILKWIGWFALLGVMIYLITWLPERYPFTLWFLPIVIFFIGIEIGWRSGSGYWFTEGPDEQTRELIQRLDEEKQKYVQELYEDVERTKEKTRAYRFGHKLGSKFRRK
ncbi:MAG: hypothetical protein ABW088_12510 [Sedimenticola sp.]